MRWSKSREDLTNKEGDVEQMLERTGEPLEPFEGRKGATCLQFLTGNRIGLMPGLQHSEAVTFLKGELCQAVIYFAKRAHCTEQPLHHRGRRE